MGKATAARRYAKALFSLAQEEGRADAVRDEVERLGRLLAESAELRAVLLQPLHPVAQRRAVLAAVAERLGASSLLRRFLSFLIDQRRLVDFESIEAEYRRLAEAAAGITKARVRSDVPVLLIVGGSDPQDPLANVRGARAAMPASRTVVVPHAGHGALQLGCLPRVAQQFVERGTAAGLDTRCVGRYAPPPFVIR